VNGNRRWVVLQSCGTRQSDLTTPWSATGGSVILRFAEFRPVRRAHTMHSPANVILKGADGVTEIRQYFFRETNLCSFRAVRRG
jgi:hypothetical protein